LPIYEFSQSGIVALKETAFSSVDMYERRDLQRLLRDNIEVIAPDTLVISEEFGEWEEARRRIDLLESADFSVIFWQAVPFAHGRESTARIAGRVR